MPGTNTIALTNDNFDQHPKETMTMMRTGNTMQTRLSITAAVASAAALWAVAAGAAPTATEGRPVTDRPPTRVSQSGLDSQPSPGSDPIQRPIDTAFAQAPDGFILPPLHPAGVQLQTTQLADGIYALLSGRPAVDNSGFVVGNHGVLVIDAHINGEMARQIQDAVRRVTNKPIMFLVNTNYHGDHTFGNYAFPPDTLIVAHRNTARHMRDFEHEKRFLLQAVNDDATVYADARLRLPDLAFDDYLRLDLGGRVVQLYHFGRGNTTGDTVVFVPDAKVAWTGNLVVGEGSIPPIFEGRAGQYLNTIARFAQTLDVQTIVPGHGRLTSGAILGRYMAYLNELITSVRRSIASGSSLDEALASIALAEKYAPAADSPAAELGPFLTGLHRLNVQQTYLELSGR